MIKKIIIGIEKFASKTKIGVHLYAKPYKVIIENEIALGKIQANDTVLNIGCGSIPFTAIYLAKLTGCKVIAIDNDIKAINNAKKVIERLSLSSLVTIKHHEGNKPLEIPFNKAILALQTTPLQSVLEALVSQEKVVMVRLPFAKYARHYDVLSSNYGIKEKIYQPMKAFGYSAIVESYHTNSSL